MKNQKNKKEYSLSFHLRLPLRWCLENSHIWCVAQLEEKAEFEPEDRGRTKNRVIWSFIKAVFLCTFMRLLVFVYLRRFLVLAHFSDIFCSSLWCLHVLRCGTIDLLARLSLHRIWDRGVTSVREGRITSRFERVRTLGRSIALGPWTSKLRKKGNVFQGLVESLGDLMSITFE